MPHRVPTPGYDRRRCVDTKGFDLQAVCDITSNRHNMLYREKGQQQKRALPYVVFYCEGRKYCPSRSPYQPVLLLTLSLLLLFSYCTTTVVTHLFIYPPPPPQEFSTSNFFGITEDNRFVTPDSPAVLPSITNKSLMELAEDEGMIVEHRPVPLSEVGSFKEVAACGTAVVMTSIKQIVKGGEVS